jgi:hypothetical protein
VRAREVNAIKRFQSHCRLIYEILFRNYGVSLNELNELLRVRNASKILRKSREEQYIVGPEIRKMSYSNFPEYMYFADCDDPDLLYQKYRKDENIISHALMYGFANLWVISKEKIDIEGDILVEGLRSDYHVAFAPNHSWDDAIQIIRKKIKEFDPKEYIPKGYIKTHFDDTIEWSETDEILYRYFKYDLRKPFVPVMDEYKICTYTVYKWLERLPECCTITTSYFPEKLSEYEPYLFLFETDYEDFVVEIFSELPSSSWFFKVSDKLFLYARVPKKYIGGDDPQTEPSELNIPSLANEPLEKGIIRRRARGPIETYWVKDI